MTYEEIVAATRALQTHYYTVDMLFPYTLTPYGFIDKTWNAHCQLGIC